MNRAILIISVAAMVVGGYAIHEADRHNDYVVSLAAREVTKCRAREEKSKDPMLARDETSQAENIERWIINRGLFVKLGAWLKGDTRLR